MSVKTLVRQQKLHMLLLCLHCMCNWLRIAAGSVSIGQMWSDKATDRLDEVNSSDHVQHSTFHLLHKSEAPAFIYFWGKLQLVKVQSVWFCYENHTSVDA